MTTAYVGLAVFALGLYGVLVRRDLVGVLASIEVMVGGALLVLVVFGAALPAASASAEAVALLFLVVAAAEAGVGLALVIALSRTSGHTLVDRLTEVCDR